MICPRCMKSISDERIQDVSEKLKAMFGRNELDNGCCPVCGTRLVRPKCNG